MKDLKTPLSDAEADTQSDATNKASYQVYFASGLYDRRYPSPNRTMWKRVETNLSTDASVLDFGCGSGRYLLRLRGRVARAIGFDVSDAALEAVRARVQDWPEALIIGPSPMDLDAHLEATGKVDLVLCLFGVLGHITDPKARMGALLRMHRSLRPGTGRLLISVPNRARRFRAEQAASGLVCYERQTEEGTPVVLNYQLFDSELLMSELSEAGFKLHRIGCESILPESWLLGNSFLRWLDSVVTPLCPPRWGYGIYAEASC